MEVKNYIPIWDKLTDTQQKMLTDYAVSRSFTKGESVHNGSMHCTGLIIVKNGRLRIFTTSEDGREITLYRLFEYDICLLSASCMLHSINFDISITAETDTDVYIVPADIYKKIMEDSAPLSNYTNELMASRFSDVMWLIEQIMWKSFDKRLAEFLINEVTVVSANTLHITHEEIGNHLGNPREVVTRMLKYFANEGLVKLSRGTIEITNIKALKNIINK